VKKKEVSEESSI